MKSCRKIIERHSNNPHININGACLDDIAHSSQCLFNMEEENRPCPRVEAEEAEHLPMRVPLRYLLKDCALRSRMVDGLDTLKGFSNGCLIYDIK